MVSELEPKIGDIRVIPRKKGYSSKQIYTACIDCGKKRWVFLKYGEREYLRCRPCGCKHSFTPEHKAAILAGSRRRWDAPGSRK